VTLSKAVVFPITIAGKPAGFITKDPGSRAHVVRIDSEYVTVAVGDARQPVAIRETDLAGRAKAALEKALSSGTPVEAAPTPAAAPSAEAPAPAAASGGQG
jgi:hypothetical protein